MDIEEKVYKMESFIKNTVEEVCKELNEKLIYISTNINTLSEQELMKISIELPTLIYSIYQQLEVIGGKADTAKVVTENKYNQKIMTLTSGTVDQKRAQASLESAEFELYVIGYQRAYKTIQGRVQAAYEFVNSAKKILSIRVAERQNVTNSNVE